MSSHGFVAGTHVRTVSVCLRQTIHKYSLLGFGLKIPECANERIFLRFQSHEEPDGDGSAADAEFEGHRVLAVMRPPPSQGTVSCFLPPLTHTVPAAPLGFVQLR